MRPISTTFLAGWFLTFANAAIAANSMECEGFLADLNNPKRVDIYKIHSIDIIVECSLLEISNFSQTYPGPIYGGKGDSRFSERNLIDLTGMLRQAISDDDTYAIKMIRDSFDEKTVNVLTLAAMSDSKILRVNSTIILANTIDNDSICVILKHLNESLSQLSTEESIGSTARTNGIGNLLGVTAVIAPWAYKENYDQISDIYGRYSDIFSNGGPAPDIIQKNLGVLGERLESPLSYNSSGRHYEFREKNIPNKIDFCDN